MNERLVAFKDVGAESLDAAAKERVRARLFAERSARGIFAGRYAIAISVFFAGAALAVFWIGNLREETIPRPPAAVNIENTPNINRPPNIMIPSSTVEEIVAPALDPPRKKVRPRVSVSPARAKVVTPPEVAVASEATLLKNVLRLLRTSQAREARAALDGYDAAYPQGVMRDEATIARVRIERLLGHDDAALSVLITRPLEHVARSTELRLLRAELLAQAGRCEEARADLDAVLASNPRAEWRARATELCSTGEKGAR